MVSARVNNSQNREILRTLTIEKWYSFDVEKQYSFLLLARNLKRGKEVQHLEDIGIDITAGPQALEAAKDEYFNLKRPLKRSVKSPDPEPKRNERASSETKGNTETTVPSNKTGTKNESKVKNKLSIFDDPESAKNLCLYSQLRRQEIQSELLDTKVELGLMTRQVLDLQKENLQKTSDIDQCKENIRLLNEQVSDLKSELKDTQNDLVKTKRELNGRIYDVESQLKDTQNDLVKTKRELNGRIYDVESQLREQKSAHDRLLEDFNEQKETIKTQNEFIKIQNDLIIKKLDQGFASRNQERHGRRISM